MFLQITAEHCHIYEKHIKKCYEKTAQKLQFPGTMNMPTF